MIPSAFPRRLFVPLFLVLALLNMAVDAVASRDCCGHPGQSRQTGSTLLESGFEGQADGGTESGEMEDACVSFCCQAATLAPLPPDAHFPIRSGWAISHGIDIPPTRHGAEIYHPPLS